MLFRNCVVLKVPYPLPRLFTRIHQLNCTSVNNLSGFASLFANQCQPPANQCDIWFADTANQNMDQGTGLEVRCWWQASWHINSEPVSQNRKQLSPYWQQGHRSPAELPSPDKSPGRQESIICKHRFSVTVWLWLCVLVCLPWFQFVSILKKSPLPCFDNLWQLSALWLWSHGPGNLIQTENG